MSRPVKLRRPKAKLSAEAIFAEVNLRARARDYAEALDGPRARTGQLADTQPMTAPAPTTPPPRRRGRK